MKVLLLLAFVVVGALAASLEHEDDLIQIKLEQKHVGIDALKARQAKKLAKLGKSARTLPKYHRQKLIDIPYKNDYIIGNVSLGGEGPFALAVSTGQTRLWVVDCQIKNIGGGHKCYNSSQSGNSINLGKDFEAIDGSVATSGTWYTDTFQYGKAKIKLQPFGVASTLTIEDNLILPVDGVFGINRLSSYAYSSHGEPTAPIENLLRPFIKKTVTVFLDKQVAPSQGFAQGSITLGGFDKNHCDGSDPFSIDMFNLDDLRLATTTNGVEYSTYTSSYTNYYAYFDSGVSTLQMPMDDLSAIYNLILPDYNWETGMYTVDCTSISNMLPITIQIDNINVSINPEQYVIDLDLGEGACALALGVVDTENYIQENLVLGTPLFRQHCVSFDFDEQQVLLYNHIHN